MYNVINKRQLPMALYPESNPVVPSSNAVNSAGSDKRGGRFPKHRLLGFNDSSSGFAGTDSL